MTTVLLALGDPDLRMTCVSYLERIGIGSLVLNRPLASLSLAPKVSWDAVLVDATQFGLAAMAGLPPRDPKPVLVSIGHVPGADVALSLPLRPSQLEQALGRMGNGHQRPLGDALTLDASRRVAQANGAEVTLTRIEFRLLSALYDRRPNDVALGDVLEAVWGSREGVGTAELVRTHVRNLRQKLLQVGLGDAVRVRRGHGYALEA